MRGAVDGDRHGGTVRKRAEEGEKGSISLFRSEGSSDAAPLEGFNDNLMLSRHLCIAVPAESLDGDRHCAAACVCASAHEGHESDEALNGRLSPAEELEEGELLQALKEPEEGGVGRGEGWG